MATPTPLMSLPTSDTRKHVVPWKTRQEFVCVYEDLYHQDEARQVQAIDRIATWKTRVGSKLPVAIESSSSLQQMCVEYSQARARGELVRREGQLRSGASMALIRFVNHMTDKGQPGDMAIPVHKIASKLGIPDWIVRLRHDATHGALPGLEVLMAGLDWALGYLREVFWEAQCEMAESKTVQPAASAGESKRQVIRAIRGAMYDFQQVRFQKIHNNSESSKRSEEDGETAADRVGRNVLDSYLRDDPLTFIKCALEDGIMMSTEEQLIAFGVNVDDLLAHQPPTVPQEIRHFWQPLLGKFHFHQAFPLLLHTAIFSLTSDPVTSDPVTPASSRRSRLRNYQLVAWLSYLLSQSKERGQRASHCGRETLSFKQAGVLAARGSLLQATLQHLTPLTVHLLKHLAEPSCMSGSSYRKLVTLLHMDTDVTQEEQVSVQDLKQEFKEKKGIPSVETVKKSLDSSDIPWALCTDIVDWSTVPIGAIPHLMPDVEEEENEEDHDADRCSDDDHFSSGRKRKSSSESEHEGPSKSVFIPKEDIL